VKRWRKRRAAERWRAGALSRRGGTRAHARGSGGSARFWSAAVLCRFSWSSSGRGGSRGSPWRQDGITGMQTLKTLTRIPPIDANPGDLRFIWGNSRNSRLSAFLIRVHPCASVVYSFAAVLARRARLRFDRGKQDERSAREYARPTNVGKFQAAAREDPSSSRGGGASPGRYFATPEWLRPRRQALAPPALGSDRATTSGPRMNHTNWPGLRIPRGSSACFTC
jgi:hypothetical protein